MTDLFTQVEDFVEKDIVEPVKTFFGNVVEPDVEAMFNAAIALVNRNGGGLLLQAAAEAVPLIATGSWGAVVAELLVNAKAAGAVLLAQEEQLAASTALQIAQASGKALTAAAPVTPTPAAPDATPQS